VQIYDLNNDATVKMHGTVSVARLQEVIKHLKLHANCHRYALRKNASTQLTLSADKNPDQDWTAYKSLESIIAWSTLFSLSDGNPLLFRLF
jgi:hypothetical protein